MAFASALKEIISRNAGIAAAYRNWALRLPPGPASRLAASMAQQRFELAKVLGAIYCSSSLPEVEVEFEADPSSFAGVGAFAAANIETMDFLRKMATAESEDHELLAAVAGAVLPRSSDVAQSLAGEAALARKRSIWAQDHLELLNMT